MMGGATGMSGMTMSKALNPGAGLLGKHDTNNHPTLVVTLLDPKSR